MFRSLTVRRSSRGYDRLANEPADQPEAKLSRARSLPARLFGKRSAQESGSIPDEARKASKIHPVFSLFERVKGRRNKATARPEFARYVEYVREGGVWDSDSGKPVIYYT